MATEPMNLEKFVVGGQSWSQGSLLAEEAWSFREPVEGAKLGDRDLAFLTWLRSVIAGAAKQPWQTWHLESGF